jgi:hypothetical protein
MHAQAQLNNFGPFHAFLTQCKAYGKQASENRRRKHNARLTSIKTLFKTFFCDIHLGTDRCRNLYRVAITFKLFTVKVSYLGVS